MTGLAVTAGIISTTIFACSVLPMVVKAVTTRDLASYSLGNLLLVNTGNAVHSLYVLSLPPGPIWVLHSVHLTTSAVMLAWYLRFARTTTTAIPRRHPCPPAHPLPPAASRAPRPAILVTAPSSTR